MPRLAPPELQNALRFELARYAPLPEDRLVWGFRALPGGDRTHQAIRLLYMRENVWRRWVEDAGGLGGGVDSIIPAAGVLDPVMAGRPVRLGGHNGTPGFVLVPAAGGGREVFPETDGGEDVFGARGQPLQTAGLDPGPIAAMDIAEQSAFADSILLGMYGLAPATARDRRTWLTVPYELRPQRNRTARFISFALVFYLLGLGAIALARFYHERASHLSWLRTEIAGLENEIGALEEETDPTEALEGLREELQDANVLRPTLPACLLELTGLIDDEAWVTKFNWNQGKIELEINATTEDVNLFQKLEGSPFFVDVIPLSKQVNHEGEVTLRLQMHAAFANVPKDAMTRAGEGFDDLPGLDDELDEPPDAGQEEADAAAAPPPPPPAPPGGE
jgi:Tfp pilus assembly protein PilN